MVIFGVAAAPLLPRVLGENLSTSADVHFRWVGGFGQIAQAVPYFLQHLLAVAAVVAGGKRFGSHLSVSFGFLPSLHVRACMTTIKGDEEDVTQSRVAAADDSSVVSLHICMLLTETHTHVMLPNRLGKRDIISRY